MLAVTSRAAGSVQNSKSHTSGVWRAGVWMVTMILLVMPCAAGRASAGNDPFGWSQNAEGRPFVVAATTVDQTKATGYSSYSPTIYPVGTDEVPSDAYNPSSEGTGRANKPGIRKGFDTPGEANQSEDYPVGEPLVLFVFAALFAGAIMLRRARSRA